MVGELWLGFVLPGNTLNNNNFDYDSNLKMTRKWQNTEKKGLTYQSLKKKKKRENIVFNMFLGVTNGQMAGSKWEQE